MKLKKKKKKSLLCYIMVDNRNLCSKPWNILDVFIFYYVHLEDSVFCVYFSYNVLK